MDGVPTAAKHAIRSVMMVGAQRARFSGNNFSASSLFLPVLRATEDYSVIFL